jgi:uncharacterized protein YndB with AHSA1/START domain
VGDATVERIGERVRLRFERELAAPPVAVWHALTDRHELAAWFPCDVIAEEWKRGGALRFVFSGVDVPDLQGTVLACDEPRVLAFTWGEETLRFELSPSGNGTRLVMTDELDAPTAARNGAGWDLCLERLAGRVPQEGRWQVCFNRYVSVFEPILGPQEGPPPGHR